MNLQFHFPKAESCVTLTIQESLSPKLFPRGKRIAYFIDENVQQLHSPKLKEFFNSEEHLIIPSGEQHKTREMKAHLEDVLLERGYGRDSLFIAIGGGVVTDLVGFLAATYCRGVPYINIPTTLLGMVDASIGGKTGVNTPLGKNMIGAIHHPQAIWISLEWLPTLPEIAFKDGLVEMIKHGLIADAAYFQSLKMQLKALAHGDCDLLKEAIRKSCLIKQRIVERDEKESGLRQVLNLGHTVGHALESASGYDLSHGTAVALGLLVECRMAVMLGFLQESHFCEIQEIIEMLEFPYQWPPVSTQELIDFMTIDKKARGRAPYFVLLEAIGKPKQESGKFSFPIESQILIEALEQTTHDLRRHHRSVQATH